MIRLGIGTQVLAYMNEELARVCDKTDPIASKFTLHESESSYEVILAQF